MGEVRCPRCGKTNPAESEVCQFCQARLISFEFSSARSEPAQTVPEESPTDLDAARNLEVESLSDWLNEENGELEQPPSKQVEDIDWLSQPLPNEEWGKSAEGESKLQADEFSKLAASGTSERSESAGPLAGLSGVLTAASINVRTRKTPTQPIKLRVSENQRGHADLLQGLVESEDQAHPIPYRRGISTQNVLRWVIILVLWGAVLWSVITNKQQAALPGYTEEIAEVNRLINKIPTEERILIAFDYQPGLSAEMDAAASAVVEHLMQRELYLTLVSTSPTGPILAERFINAQTGYDYVSGVNYANLGYVPGGVIGLLSFVENPQSTLPYTLDMVAAWENESHPALPALQGVQSISDFGLLLVIVDDPDVARAWVEQVQPQLSDSDTSTPLVMVTSAQIEPVMRPYFEANPRQVDGFVFGLRGGAAYAQLTGLGELPRTYWGTYGFGLVVAALLILIGGLLLSSYSMLTGPPQAKGKVKQ